MIRAGLLTWSETERAAWVDMERAHLVLDMQDLADAQARERD